MVPPKALPIAYAVENSAFDWDILSWNISFKKKLHLMLQLCECSTPNTLGKSIIFTFQVSGHFCNIKRHFAVSY